MRTEDSVEATAPATDFSVLRINKRRAAPKPRRRDRDAARTRFDRGRDRQPRVRRRRVVQRPDQSVDVRLLGRDRDARARPACNSSYRGAFNWNADRTGLQVEHLYVGDNFNPEVGFLRRTAFRRSYGQGRFSPRPTHVRGVRKLFFEGSMDYYEDTGGTVESREAQATFRMEFDDERPGEPRLHRRLRAPRRGVRRGTGRDRSRRATTRFARAAPR